MVVSGGWAVSFGRGTPVHVTSNVRGSYPISTRGSGDRLWWDWIKPEGPKGPEDPFAPLVSEQGVGEKYACIKVQNQHRHGVIPSVKECKPLTAWSASVAPIQQPPILSKLGTHKTVKAKF